MNSLEGERCRIATALLMTRQLECIRLFDHHSAVKKHDELMAEISSALDEANAQTPEPQEKEQAIVKSFVPKPSKRNKFDRLTAINNGLSSKRNKSRQLPMGGKW